MDIVVHVRDLGSSCLSALPGMAKVCMVQPSCSYKKLLQTTGDRAERERTKSPPSKDNSKKMYYTYVATIFFFIWKLCCA